MSVEPVGNEAMPAEMTGIDAIRQKNERWLENYEVNSAEVNGPFVGGDQFAVQYVFDTTFKPTGQRSVMTEMALYQVKDGKSCASSSSTTRPRPRRRAEATACS